MSGPTISAQGHVRVAPEVLHEFLADLDNHRRLTTYEVRVLALDGEPGARDGGRFLLRGPLGVSRRMTTRLEAVEPGNGIVGSAELDGGTRAQVRWSLTPAPGGTQVRLEATVLEAGALDAALLRIGARRWLEARLREAIAALADAAGEGSASARPQAIAARRTP